MGMSDLSIDVDVYGGTHIPDAIKQMVDLANRMQITIWATLNGVRTLARPGDDAEEIHKAWERAMETDVPHKYASQGRAKP